VVDESRDCPGVHANVADDARIRRLEGTAYALYAMDCGVASIFKVNDNDSVGIGPTVDVLLIRRHCRVHGFVEAGDSAIRVRSFVDVHVVVGEVVDSSDARHCYLFFYSIATVACGNAAVVSTEATQQIVIRGSPKPNSFEPLACRNPR